MHARCTKSYASGYENYGGRGIKMCPKWRNSFEEFFKDMGPKPSAHHTVERKDVNGDYEQDNCIWLLRVDQSKNKRNSIKLEINGEVKLVKDWCRHYNITYELVRGRLRRGWTKSIETLFEPPRNEAWNSKCNSVQLYELDGVKKRLRQWCISYNVDYKQVWSRINKLGWDLKEALTNPINKPNKNDTSIKN